MRRLQLIAITSLMTALSLTTDGGGAAAQGGDDTGLSAPGVVVGYGPNPAPNTDPSTIRHPDIDDVSGPSAAPGAGSVHESIGAGTMLVRLVLDPTASATDVAASLAAAGTAVVAQADDALVVVSNRRGLEAIVASGLATWAEPLRLPEPHNDAATSIVGSPIAQIAGFDGSGQIIAVADTGIGGGTAATAHRDIDPSRIVHVNRIETAGVWGCFAVLDDGAADVDSGHGTHVATTALGSGGPGGEGRGIAPGASLYFQSVEDWVEVDPVCEPFLDDGYALVGIPLDIGDLLAPAYAAGARIHQDSWGASVSGEYDQSAADVDAFVAAHPDMTVVVSAGNDGDDADADGSVDAGSLSSPATAKNVIAVGASENDRDSYPCDPATGCSGVNSIPPYGWSAEPYTSDAYAGDAEQIAAFSSRGPTADGRVKPDVVAPGTWVLSGYSDMHQLHYDSDPNPQNGLFQDDGWGNPFNSYYKYFGGTSMAAPMVSGGAAILRQFYVDAEGWEPSAALVKATLINSAKDLTDENNDGIRDNAEPIPNDHEGWGRIDLHAATDGSHGWFDGDSVESGMARTYATAVHSGTPLRVSLVWSDPAGAPGCGACLINDLDLIIEGPDGSIYMGNNFVAGWTPAGTAAPDRTNNVENVYVAAPAPGVWTIRVQGAEVPSGQQAFALVFDADFDLSIDVEPPTWPSPSLEATEVTADAVSLSWTAATDDTAVVAYDVFTGTTLLASVSTTQTTISGLADSTPYTLRVEARDARANRSVDNPAIAVTTLDGTAPAWPDPRLEVVDVGETWVELAWNSADDDSSVEYELAVDGGVAASQLRVLDPVASSDDDEPVDEHRGILSGLAAATDYHIGLTAIDSLGHRSTMIELSVRTASDFIDTEDHTFERDIAWLSGMGITGGCTPTLYCPDAAMTRAQMASLLSRALNLTPSSESTFVDVAGVHAEAVDAIAAAGITVGCREDRFCPDDPVTRAQMATFLDRAFTLAWSDVDRFADDEGSVHEAAINRVAAAGITLGCDEVSYCPSIAVTRGQMAAFLHRALSSHS